MQHDFHTRNDEFNTEFLIYDTDHMKNKQMQMYC